MFKRYSYAWITVAFFLISISLHWWLSWEAYIRDAATHGQAPDTMEFLIIAGRDTFENWQSEFLQLLWQVVGLAYFLYAGSPASKENSDRTEVKIDALLRIVGGPQANQLIDDIDDQYMRGGGVTPYGHGEELARAAGSGITNSARD